MAFTYRNGFIPLDKMIVFYRGWSKVDGNYYHALSPSTYRKHLALVARAKQRTGRTLQISRGWSAYRPYDAQVHARRIHGVGAAWPGTSSHGGFWEGQQTLAMDYGNWAWVYERHGGKAQFFADCRAVGLTPDMISRRRGYPDEPWHVIDLDPWAPVPAGSITLNESQEDDMYSDADRKRDQETNARANAAYAAIFGARNLTGKADPISWLNINGRKQETKYGALPIVIHTQTLVAQQAGRLAAMEKVVEQLASANGAVLDMQAIEDAAERGAKDALGGLVLTAATDG